MFDKFQFVDFLMKGPLHKLSDNLKFVGHDTKD